MLLKEIIGTLDKLAPPELAYKWDNPGLQVGEPEQEIRKILLTLDVTEQVVQTAIDRGFDLIISHHPLIFRELKKITDPLLIKLIRHRISVFTLHTNLDVIRKGVNHALAERLELKIKEFISPETGADIYQVAVYVPKEAVGQVSEAVFTAGAGIIGKYDHCLNKYRVTGQFRPLEESNPFLGSENQLTQVEETKLEFFTDSFNLQKVISGMIGAHPYETPAYAVYPQNKYNQNYGLGFICDSDLDLNLVEFAEYVREKLQAEKVKLWTAGREKSMKIRTAAICGGSGSSLLPEIAGRADVFVSGDFTYHTLLDSRIPIIDAGHFHTEFPVLKKLQKELSQLNLEINIVNKQEHDINRESYI